MATPDLASYDWIVVNTSAGKDSQAMLDEVVGLADVSGVRDRLVAVHADLGRVEWPGTRELAAEQAARYGVRFEVVRRRGTDLLDRVRERGKFPDSARRWCTSDFKRSPVAMLHTGLAAETGRGRRVAILNCLGMRAQESPARAKLPPFIDGDRGKNDDGKVTPGTNGRKRIDAWHPIHDWSVEQVWARIRESGVPWHPAYDKGMPRLSCMFCIFSPKAALMVAGKSNRPLLDQYVAIEQETGHDFRHGFKIAEVAAALDRGEEPGRIQDWTM
jgi:3'-phosphoadenosine 5'-phosphosulfate sulfotransferase (PAPS reductase)/FAD synthetase